MMTPPRHSPHSSSLKQKRFLICLLLISIPSLIIVIIISAKHQKPPLVGTALSDDNNVHEKKGTKPAWFDVIAKGIKEEKIKIGLVNIQDDEELVGSLHHHLHPKVETLTVNFDHVNESLKWEELYPEWIDENERWGKPKCPEMAMAAAKEDLNVVVARVPSCGVRDVFRLQVNLVVANLAVENGWVSWVEFDHRVVYVVFVGSSSSCGPMEEIFRCDDLLMHNNNNHNHQEGGYYWVYKPDLRSLKHKTLMPIGSCQIAPAYAEPGKETWRWRPEKKKQTSSTTLSPNARTAYVTILHSSELYVCGAISLAQSIIQNPDKDTHRLHETKDLVLLADDSITSESLTALKAAGWNKIKRIQRIRSPFAKKSSYNEWNYSKLRIWELTMYEKIIFLDSDVLVLKSIHGFFYYPQLSAAPNEKAMFNSGVMVIEPSQCMFENMLDKIHKVKSYNGGDQGFLNEVFAWWHRTPSKLNKLKTFRSNNSGNHDDDEDLYTIHYLGLKPWMCYRDYDCNWDKEEYRMFASDLAHQKWWQVYDAMPKELQSYCGLSNKMNQRIVKWRRMAMNDSTFDAHSKIQVKDPRRNNYHVA
ncbi:hypothetical protein HN51_014667 [Arachis hypogaea]|uniref:Hexosyltransferase n=1 Tax=Arachis hypogaea TaxID=3818 RepID=A0A445CNJ5_ARAHY|nr:putative UDP-glucuronate:xylan alpha-glucuronosyltransferase 4 [Arachis hypogaea]RYR52497.1 hypothetical protein Ahy_A06g027405 [Arachis hypogaea]